MKKVISIFLKVTIVVVMLFLITNYYINNIANKDNLFSGVFLPEAIETGESKMYEDPQENFEEQGFYIKIPRIELFKAVVKDVDPTNKSVYVASWENGVSHGKYTAYPDQIGNSYFFAHSVSNEAKVDEENAWFSKLTSVEIDDFVFVYYEGVEYKYQIVSMTEVDPSATGVYTGIAPVQKVTLQTCPNGSLDSRLIVDALLIETRNVLELSREEIYSYEEVNANV